MPSISDLLATNESVPSRSPSALLAFMDLYPGRGFASISVTGGSTEQGSIDTNYAKLTCFTANSTNFRNATPAHGTDIVTLGAQGNWLVAFSCSFTGTASTKFIMQVGLTGDGTVHGGVVERTTDAAGAADSVCVLCLISGASAGDVVQVNVKSTAPAKAVTVSEGSLLVTRLSN